MRICWKIFRGEVYEKDHQFWKQEVGPFGNKKDRGQLDLYGLDLDITGKKMSSGQVHALGIELECQQRRE